MIKPIKGTLAACIALSLLAACGDQGGGEAPGEPPLAGASIGGPFELVNSAGETVRWADFDGKYRIVYFGYAYCPDVCPTDVARFMRGYAQFKEAEPELAAQVQPIFISIDPDRDTPAVVGEFTNAFSDDLIGLTGSQEQVNAAASAFSVYHEKGEENEEGGYLMNHSSATYLFGREGQPIALLPTDVGPEAVAAELEKWVF
ncbi:SCO family protein [Croceibacterium atlanticum]|nr:SCO family protein [Croceibacterium atlanticum]